MNAVVTPAAIEKRRTRPFLILGICCMSLLLTGMDVTIVNVALPAIGRDLHATLSQLQWIVDSYTLVLASFVVLAGSMSDRFGRRRVFQIGLFLFTGGSLVCSLAPGIHALIAFRAMQGLGAAMLNPVALSIIVNVFPAPEHRARAVGIWGAVAGLSFALGPLLGGILIQAISWRSVFWVNIPIGLVVVALTAAFVPESKAARARRFDPLGQMLAFAALAALVFAIIDGPLAGWGSDAIVGSFALAACAVVAFVLYEPRRSDPLIDLRFFRSVPFSSAVLLGVCAFGALSAMLFLNALYLQQVRGFSAFRTGLYTLPMAAMLTVTAPFSGRLVGAHGPQPSLFISGAAFLLSALVFIPLSATTPLGLLLVAYMLFGIGLGMINPAISNSAVAGMPLSQAGVAAALASTGRQVGAALGVAIAGTVVGVCGAHSAQFSQATHPVWWGIAVAGVVILLLASVSNTRWSRASVERVAFLFQ